MTLHFLFQDQVNIKNLIRASFSYTNPKGLARPDKVVLNPLFKKPGLNFMYRVMRRQPAGLA